MQKPDFILTENDGALLTDARRVEHPAVLAPFLDRLPEDTRGMKVVAAYDIAEDDLRGKASCGVCHHRNNHRKGLVAELPNGSRATIGRVCCEKKPI